MPNTRWTKTCKAEIWLRTRFRDGLLTRNDIAKQVFDDNYDVFGGYKYPTFYKHWNEIRKEERKFINNHCYSVSIIYLTKSLHVSNNDQ